MIDFESELIQKNKAGAYQRKPAAGKTKHVNINTPKKWVRVLLALSKGKSYNRFEAERQLNDHCLHSTISTLTNDYGISINRKEEKVPGYQGIPTRVKRYSLERSTENLKRVQELLQRNEAREVPV